ncbi:hypothetical protein MCEMSEM18_03654 [Comamonadaceae bacterium]
MTKLKKTLVVGVLGCMYFTAHAALPSDEAVVGQVLDASGVVMKGFQARALPLPPGTWKIAGRVETQIKLTGGTHDSVPQISLTLENQDAASPLLAAIVTYTPEQVGVRWNSNTACDTIGAKANWFNDFGKTTNSLVYACTNHYVYTAPKTFKSYLEGLEQNKNVFYKTRLAPVVPNAAKYDFGYHWLWGSFNKDKGRNISVTFISKVAPDWKAGDATEARLKEWGAQMGEAYIDWLDGGQKVIPVFPGVNGN